MPTAVAQVEPAVADARPTTIVFSHANGFPSGTYETLFERWRAAGYRVIAVDRYGHDPAYPVSNNWPHLRDQLIDFIEATRETCFFQVGESKYGKPILARVLTPATQLDEAAKCALVSMDSTLKSNLSVGLPLDLLVYREGSFHSDEHVCIDDRNPYFQMIHSTWGQRLREVFEGIDDPRWDGGDAEHPLMVRSARYEPMRKITTPGERIV